MANAQTSSNPRSLSIIIPAKNEAAAIGDVVGGIVQRYPQAQVIVVDDGSSDDTASVAQRAGAQVVSHPHSLGNGAAGKAGARAATGDILDFLDRDGQHNPADIPRLLEHMAQGHDMVIGARASAESHARQRKSKRRNAN